MSAVEAVREQGPFSARMAAILVCVGVFAFSCLVVVFAYAPDLRGAADPKAHALSRSAIGYAGLVRLLRDQDLRVLVSRDRPLEELKTHGIGIFAPDPDADIKEVRKALFENRNLIILPKWLATPDPKHPGWVRKAGLLPAGTLQDGYLKQLIGPVTIARRKDFAPPRLQGVNGGPGQQALAGLQAIDSLQTISSPKLVPLVVDPSGGVVLGRFDLGSDGVYVLADPDLANTHGLADPATARLMMASLRHMGGGPFVFDVTLNGYRRERSLLRLAFEPPFLAVTLCAAFAGLLMGLHAAARFGPARRSGRAIALGKQALADNSAALVALARREASMATPYAVLTRSLVARAIGAPPDLDIAELNAFLERVGERRKVGVGLKQLLEQASAVRTPGDLVRVAHDLFRWRVEMTRESS
jgi:hypothetical protein